MNVLVHRSYTVDKMFIVRKFLKRRICKNTVQNIIASLSCLNYSYLILLGLHHTSNTFYHITVTKSVGLRVVCAGYT